MPGIVLSAFLCIISQKPPSTSESRPFIEKETAAKEKRSSKYIVEWQNGDLNTGLYCFKVHVLNFKPYMAWIGSVGSGKL